MEAATQTEEHLYVPRKLLFYHSLNPCTSSMLPGYESFSSDMQASAQMLIQGHNISRENTAQNSHNNLQNGFHSHQDEDVKVSQVKRKFSLSSYLIALRPWSFTVSIIPVALGSVLAYKSRSVFDVYIFCTAVFTAVCVHAAGNLVNTYCDFMKGVDDKKSDDRTLVDDILTPGDVVTLGAVFYIAGCVGFMMLNLLSPARLEHLALVYFCGLSSSFFYTGGLGLKYIALGDILIVLTFGPLSVVFSYLSQTGQLSLVPLIYAIPLALNTEAILHSNNSRDMDSDKQAGMLTLAILLGKAGSYCLLCFLLFVPYLLFLTVGIHYSKWMLLPAASVLFAFQLERNFRRGNLRTIPQEMAKLNLIMGVLYVIAVYLSSPQSLPSLTSLSE